MSGILILQLLTAGLGIGGILAEAYLDKDSENSTRKWVIRGVTIAGFVIGVGLVILAQKDNDEKDRRQQEQIKNQGEQLSSFSTKIESSQREQISLAHELAESQKKLISSGEKVVESQNEQLKLSKQLREAQQKGIAQVRRLSLDRNLSEMEISFRPSTKHWARIAKKYENVGRSPVPEIPYRDAAMKAQRIGDYWKINFLPISKITNGREEGEYRFPPLSTNQPNNKPFEEVIREALVPLLLIWGSGLETDLEPWYDDYPATITISQSLIAFSLQSPTMRLNLSHLNKNRSVVLRGRGADLPNDLRLHSLDPGVTLNQTIHLEWKEARGPGFAEKLKPKISGPHPLKIRFETF